MPDDRLGYDQVRTLGMADAQAYELALRSAAHKIGAMIFKKILNGDSRYVVQVKHEVVRAVPSMGSYLDQSIKVDRFRVRMDPVNVQKVTDYEYDLAPIWKPMRIDPPVPWYKRLAAEVVKTWDEAGAEVERCKV